MSKATFGQALQALNLIHAKDPSLERLDALYSSGILSDLLDTNACLDDRDSVRKALKLGVALPENLTLSVDYSRSLETMIAAGQYDWKNDDITAKKFPVQGSGVQQFEALLLHWDKGITSDDAIKSMAGLDEENPWQPGRIEHLLSFGEKYPGEQRKYPIIGLGSVARVGGGRDVPGLGVLDRGRRLGLGWWGGGWGGRYRFLAVRAVKPVSLAI